MKWKDRWLNQVSHNGFVLNVGFQHYKITDPFCKKKVDQFCKPLNCKHLNKIVVSSKTLWGDKEKQPFVIVWNWVGFDLVFWVRIMFGPGNEALDEVQTTHNHTL